MQADWTSWIAPGLFLALLAVAGISDIARRKIPNWTVLALVVVWIGAAIAGQAIGPWYLALVAAVIAFAIGYALYHFGLMGAGDAKLFTAGALFANLAWMFQFALITALLGGVLAIGYLILRPKKVMRGLTAQGRAEALKSASGIPYGVPIAMAAAATAYLNKFLAPLF
jgi:prepilin peptidase CpaA